LSILALFFCLLTATYGVRNILQEEGAATDAESTEAIALPGDGAEAANGGEGEPEPEPAGDDADGEGEEGAQMLPGMDQLAALFEEGGFGEVLLNSCPGIPDDFKISDTCLEQVGVIPTMISSVLGSMDMSAVDVAPICGACTTEEVLGYLDKIREGYDPANLDPTCGGSVPDILADDAIFQLTKIFMTASCIKNGDGDDAKYCFDPEVLPKAMEEAGLLDLMAGIDFNDLSSAMGLMGSIDIPAICRGMEMGGCCSSMMLDIVKAMLELVCLDSPLMRTGLTMTTSMCSGMEDTCSSFIMPSYDAPGDCPPANEFFEMVTQTVPMGETAYAGCTLSACPKNDCELFMCKPIY